MKKFEWVKNIVNWVKTGQLYDEKMAWKKKIEIFYELLREKCPVSAEISQFLSDRDNGHEKI